MPYLLRKCRFGISMFSQKESICSYFPSFCKIMFFFSYILSSVFWDTFSWMTLILYWVIFKKVSFGVFKIILVSKDEKNFTIVYRWQRQRAIFEQVYMIFGRCQNHQNQTFKRPYQPKRSWFENHFYAKINTTLRLYRVFLKKVLHKREEKVQEKMKMT